MPRTIAVTIFIFFIWTMSLAQSGAQLNRDPATVKFVTSDTTKLSADGNTIDVSETATFDTPEGAVNIQATRKWVLSPDGKTLKIEMTVDRPNGKQIIKRTFTRK